MMRQQVIYIQFLCVTLQVGGGFGQTICLVDVNGDGIDEILVAAPNWFYDDISRNQVIHDVGKVYVYYGNIDSSKVWKITNILKYIFFLQLIVSYPINYLIKHIKRFWISKHSEQCRNSVDHIFDPVSSKICRIWLYI